MTDRRTDGQTEFLYQYRASAHRRAIKNGKGRFKPGTHWRQSRKDVRHSADKNYPLWTKSTEPATVDF